MQWCGYVNDAQPVTDRLVEFAKDGWKNKAFRQMTFGLYCPPNAFCKQAQVRAVLNPSCFASTFIFKKFYILKFVADFNFYPTILESSCSKYFPVPRFLFIIQFSNFFPRPQTEILLTMVYGFDCWKFGSKTAAVYNGS